MLFRSEEEGTGFVKNLVSNKRLAISRRTGALGKEGPSKTYISKVCVSPRLHLRLCTDWIGSNLGIFEPKVKKSSFQPSPLKLLKSIQHNSRKPGKVG